MGPGQGNRSFALSMKIKVKINKISSVSSVQIFLPRVTAVDSSSLKWRNSVFMNLTYFLQISFQISDELGRYLSFSRVKSK